MTGEQPEAEPEPDRERQELNRLWLEMVQLVDDMRLARDQIADLDRRLQVIESRLQIGW